MNEANLKTEIKSWYMADYKAMAEDEGWESVIDEEAEADLVENITFEELYERMKNKEDIYKIIGDVDSVVRERIMRELSNILDVEYNVIYKLWLNAEKF